MLLIPGCIFLMADDKLQRNIRSGRMVMKDRLSTRVTERSTEKKAGPEFAALTYTRQQMKSRRFILVAVSNLAVFAVLFALAEFTYRKLRLRHAVISIAPYYQYDSRLGWVPRPGRYPEHGVTINLDYFRRTPLPEDDSEVPVILAVGCSYTFCEQVADEETWPSYLSRQLGVRVVNAGVSSYGFDQIALRLRDEIDSINPDLVIVAIIWQDIVYRSRLSYRRHHKPYFDIVDGRLELFNQPVPPPWENPIQHPWYERSLLIRDLVHLLSGSPGFVNEVVAHDNALEVGRRLIAELREELEERGVPWIIAIIPTQSVPPPLDRKNLREINLMMGDLGAPVYDLWEEMKLDFPAPGQRRVLFDEHMSPEGNRWVASVFSRILRSDPHLKFPVRDD